MDLAYGLPLVAVLLYGLYMARRIARRNKLRRYQSRRPRARTADITTTQGHASARSEMRAYGDPTTVMDRITKKKPPAVDPGAKQAPPKGRS